ARKQLADHDHLHRLQLASRDWQLGEMTRVSRLLDGCQEELRDWEWHYLRRAGRTDLLTLRGHAKAVWGVAFSPDGKRVASAGDDGTVRLWDSTTGKELFRQEERNVQVRCVTFSP